MAGHADGAPVDRVTLFLCGDVMTGRGIDQILPQPCDPAIHEPCADSALDYVDLAEQAHGPVPRAVDASYIWGEALGELARVAPQARIVNLETAITCHEDWLPKGINYRMNPAHVACLTAAGIDCCALANNHVLDWGQRGLADTLLALHTAGIRTAGAGCDSAEAEAPAVLPLAGGGRVLVFSLGCESSGVAASWAATPRRPGVARLDDLSPAAADAIGARVRAVRRPGDLVVVSIHWSGNWGYAIPAAELHFAHALIERAGVDVVHGHSSHHPKAIEVYRGKLVLYGCGDFINDYEGIGGHERFRGDLGLMYFPTFDVATGRLLGLELVATRLRRFRVERATAAETLWLRAVLDREGTPFGSGTQPGLGGRIQLRWQGDC